MNYRRSGARGPHTYATPGVLVRFELLPEREEEGGVFLGYSPETAICIDDAPAVRSALREKLRKYRFPIIVALQGIHTGDLFEAAEKVLFGTEVFVIPVGPRGATGPARLDRQQDSAVWQNDSDGARIRTRLDAVLPFEVGVGDQGFFLRARLMANPARPSVAGLESFRPMSTLVHADAETMRYTGPEGRYLRDDERVQDYFVPEGST